MILALTAAVIRNPLPRKFCNAQHAKYAGRDDCCAKWRFKPVRVRETVQVA